MSITIQEKNRDYYIRNRDRIMKRNHAEPDALSKKKARAYIRSRIYSGKMPDAKQLACDKCGDNAKKYLYLNYNLPPVVVPVCCRCFSKTA